MNVLVTGANGQLGMEIRALTTGGSDRYVFTCLHEAPGVETVLLDVTNRDALDIVCKAENIDVIVNCSAYNDVNRAEDDFQLADAVNRQGAENLARTALENNAVLIHVSTDYVFDGNAHRPYNEQDDPMPLNSYAATKLAGERAVAASGCKYFILRTSWLYSGYGKNFVKTMRGALSHAGSVKVVCDQVGTPTHARDLASFIVWLVSSRRVKGDFGLYHYSNEGVASWYDFAVEVGRLLSLPGAVVPCLSSEYPQKAARPKYSVLDKSLIKKTFGVRIPYWRDSLEELCKNPKFI